MFKECGLSGWCLLSAKRFREGHLETIRFFEVQASESQDATGAPDPLDPLDPNEVFVFLQKSFYLMMVFRLRLG